MMTLLRVQDLPSLPTADGFRSTNPGCRLPTLREAKVQWKVYPSTHRAFILTSENHNVTQRSGVVCTNRKPQLEHLKIESLWVQGILVRMKSKTQRTTVINWL